MSGMMERTWSSAMALGVARMDVEHEVLLAAADAFRYAVKARRPGSELEESLRQLILTVEDHFASEEALMRDSGYAALEAHAAEHARLVAQLGAVNAELASGAINPCGALAVFVEVWTKEHIQGPDRQFARHLSAVRPLAEASS
jgi:hemerythrin